MVVVIAKLRTADGLPFGTARASFPRLRVDIRKQPFSFERTHPMGANAQFLTTKEYADRSGLSVSKITKLLRDGGIKGQKVAGKWMIPASELAAAPKPGAPLRPAKSPQKSAAKAATYSAPSETGQTYSVTAFSAMTYLTDNGVRSWLKKGLLQGARAEDGEWRIDAANLEVPHVKRLVR